MDKCRLLNIAKGSLEECRYYLILTKDLNYGDVNELTEQLQEVSKLLTAYTESIQNSEISIQKEEKDIPKNQETSKNYCLLNTEY